MVGICKTDPKLQKNTHMQSLIIMKLHSIAKGFRGKQMSETHVIQILTPAARSDKVSRGILFSYTVSAENTIHA